ncbi:MAG: acyl-CoA dehydrogenase family protein, partial [Cellvibrionaceae bacterium]|nr:acyl-CoA dehydrogenase family protein [Cellvibrionaceae bacterium]
MNVDFSAEELAFQQEVRDFLADKLPAEIGAKVLAGTPTSKDDHIRWQKILAEQGWAAVNWPVEHGGTGWSPTQKYIWANECAVAGAPDVVPFGMKMVAPVIYTFGNEEQKQRFLP